MSKLAASVFQQLHDERADDDHLRLIHEGCELRIDLTVLVNTFIGIRSRQGASRSNHLL